MTDWRQPRSLRDFGKLTPAERRVLDELQTGRTIVIGDPIPDPDAPGGVRIPVPDHGAPHTLHIRASFIRWLALGDEKHPLHEKGLRIAGALIVGHGPRGGETRGLDLEGCELARDLGLFGCRFTDPLLLRNARLQTLFLNGAHFPGLSADGLKTRGGVFLRGAEVAGEMRLVGARIGSNLECDGAKLRNMKENALSADMLETRGHVILRGAEIDGEVRVLGGRVGGDFECAGVKLRNPKGKALFADGLETRGGVFLSRAEVGAAEVDGEVRLIGALVGGTFGLESAKLRNSEGTALHADGLQTRHGVVLRGAEVDGEARLLGGRIGGDLECVGAKLRNAGGWALAADRLELRRSVFLRGAEIDGEVRLLGAQIGSDLDCTGAKLRSRKDMALNANGACITGTLSLRRGAVIAGKCDLCGTRLGTITDDPDCWPGEGELVLDRCEYGAFTGEGVDAETRIRWLAKQNPARFGQDFWPQPWEQCAKVFREMGHSADARAVLIDKEWRQRADRRRRMGPFWRRIYWLVDNLLRVTVRYGRQPLWAFAWLAGFWLLGVVIFHDADHNDAIKPNNAFVLRAEEWAFCAYPRGAEVYDERSGLSGIGRAGQERGQVQSQLACFRDQPESQKYPRFNSWVYSLDTLLPVVEMEMQAFWIPDEKADWPLAVATRAYLWFHIAVGWALSLLAIAGFSGLVKTD